MTLEGKNGDIGQIWTFKLHVNITQKLSFSKLNVYIQMMWLEMTSLQQVELDQNGLQISFLQRM